MRAEIVCIGTELLLGNIVNTNAAQIAQALAVYGVDVFHHSTVGDNVGRCVETLRRALDRADAVIITGGIGPTPDDATREAMAQVLGVPLERRPELVEVLERRYASRQRVPTPSAYKQAELPAGATVIPNPVGTAPGVLALWQGKAMYAMPGVPHEMRRMLAESVLPDLKQRYGLDTGLFARVLHTRGVGESDLATWLDDLLQGCSNPTVATYVKTGEVEVRLTCRATDAEAAGLLFEPLERDIRARVGEFVFAVDDEGLDLVLGRRLIDAGATLATAESCTGGQLGEAITSVPGSSQYYVGGIVAYSNALKERMLAVPREVIERDGAVSEACAAAMAAGVATQLGADYGLATTGIAGPDGGTPEKPVGLVYIALYDGRTGETVTAEHRWAGDRATVRERTTLAALDLACQQLAGSKKR